MYGTQACSFCGNFGKPDGCEVCGLLPWREDPPNPPNTRVVDMTKIEVTQKHIDEANWRRSAPGYDICRMCPIALAASEALQEPIEAGVGSFSRTKGAVTSFSRTLPRAVTAWQKLWDNHYSVEPITFEIELPLR